jgi:hypothetical protein
MQKLLNSRRQGQSGQIGTEELSQNVAGLGRQIERGGGNGRDGERGCWPFKYSCYGDSAAVR